MRSKIKYDADQIRYVKRKLNIVDALYYDLKIVNADGQYRGRCPYCGGTYSLMINEKRQIADCYFCWEKFDIIGYFQIAKQVPFMEAYRMVKIRYNLADKLTFKKLIKSLDWLTLILQDKTSIVLDADTREIISKFSDLLTELLEDYCVLTLDKVVDEYELEGYRNCFSSIISGLDNKNDETTKLINMFSYLLQVCDIIENNDRNLGGLVYIPELLRGATGRSSREE